MSKGIDETSQCPERIGDELTEICREGARRLLASALEAEVTAYIEKFAGERDPRGRRLVVRNGTMPERTILTGVGPIRVEQPRVDDRRVSPDGERCRFTSSVLPRYLRRTKSLEELIPFLYLKGVSTGDFSEALAALVGPGAPGLSATTITRLKEVWEKEYEAWCRRDLKGKRYIYLWVDGIYCHVRLTGDRPCLLVIIGATEEGEKELVAVHDGERESELSWRELLSDLKRRGLKVGAKLAVGDGALGFWAALAKIYPGTDGQRCWVHKTANVLDKLPDRVQPSAKKMLHAIWQSPTKSEAEKAMEAFVETYQAKYPKAVDCLVKDREALLRFYDYPAEHWAHIRTTNPIESTFATVRLRTARTKGSGSRSACLTMVYKLARSAEGHWRRLNGSNLLQDVLRGVKFVDGEKSAAA